MIHTVITSHIVGNSIWVSIQLILCYTWSWACTPYSLTRISTREFPFATNKKPIYVFSERILPRSRNYTTPTSRNGDGISLSQGLMELWVSFHSLVCRVLAKLFAPRNLEMLRTVGIHVHPDPSISGRHVCGLISLSVSASKIFRFFLCTW